jgi:hypothetical protein
VTIKDLSLSGRGACSGGIGAGDGCFVRSDWRARMIILAKGASRSHRMLGVILAAVAVTHFLNGFCCVTPCHGLLHTVGTRNSQRLTVTRAPSLPLQLTRGTIEEVWTIQKQRIIDHGQKWSLSAAAHLLRNTDNLNTLVLYTVAIMLCARR